MKYCLWLFGKKVYTLDGVLSDFDLDSLTAYLLGGSLGRWLRSIGEDTLAENAEKIDLGGDISAQLRRCFGLEASESNAVNTPQPINAAVINSAGYPVPSYAFEYHPFGCDADDSQPPAPAISNAHLPTNANGSFTSSFSGSYGSFTSSFGSGRLLGSGLGSFAFGGSYSSLLSGSFGVSYRFGGSGSLGGSFSLGNITSFGGSFVISASGVTLTADEYKRTMANLTSCPLNSRGYGIHRI